MGFDFKGLVEYILPTFFKEYKFNEGTTSNPEPFSYWDEILILAGEYPDRRSLEVQYKHIEFFDRELAQYVLDNPEDFLKACRETLFRMPLPVDKELDVETRIVGLPDIYTVPISKLRKNHLGKLISIVCTVTKITESRPRYKKAAFVCLRCGHVNVVPQPDETDILQEPVAGCENTTCGKRGPYKISKNQSELIDIQYLKVQEPIENLHGRQPEFLYVVCTEDLAGICQPGEKLVITGILQGRHRVKKEGKTQIIDPVLIANSIVSSKKDFETISISSEEEKKILEISQRKDIFDIISQSIAPSVYGHEKIKQGVALQLFSGIRKDNEDGTFTRGDVHILLIGDPGVAKSQLLKFVSTFAPRGLMVSGRSASGSGLTGAAVFDDFTKRWSIEGGAFSMVSGSDTIEGGICAVDEMDKMGEKDRATIHGALEQQYVDIAKAGIVAHMPTRLALLGAANPKYGRYDPYEPIASQFNLGDALLSRMDLIFVVRDVPDQEFDRMLAYHVLEQGWGKKETLFDLELLRKYIAYAKTHCYPKMTKRAIDYIVNFYVTTRNASEKAKDAPPVTVRQLQAAERLAIAHARLRLSNEVTVTDARVACDLLLHNLHEVGIDPDTKELDASVLESGTSLSQRQKISALKEIIDRLSKADLVYQAANRDLVLEKAREAGIQNPEDLIKKMKQRGDIFTPTPLTLKLVSAGY